MHSSVTIVGVLIGVVILFFGRKLFWLCVAAVGFAVGVEIAPLLVNEASSLLALVNCSRPWGTRSVARTVPSESCDCCTRFLSRRKASHGDRRFVLCALCPILDHHFRHRWHHRGDSAAGCVWLGTDRCFVLYRRVLDSKRLCAAANRFDTRVHRPRNPRHIRAGSIVPPKCDIEHAHCC